MNIAVSLYCYYQAIRDGRMTIMDVIPKAKEMGYEGIEIVSWGDPYEKMLKSAKEMKKLSEDVGLPIIAYLTGSDFLKNDMDEQVDTLKRELDIAAAFGVTRMRHDSTAGYDKDGKLMTVDEALPIVAEGYRRVTEYAETMGIQTMIENHGYFFQHSSRVKRLMEAVNHKNFGWLVDMGNFMCADEKSTDAVKNAAPYAVHVHAKDFHYKKKGEYIPPQRWFPTADGNSLRGAIIGHGVVDVPECLRIFKSHGYDGWLSVEFEGMEDCIQGLTYNLTNLREMLNQ